MTAATLGAGEHPDLARTNPRFGDTLADRRKTANLSQHQLAALSGVKQSTISYLESGKTDAPTIDILTKLAIALECAPADLAPDLAVSDSGQAIAPNGIRAIRLDEIDTSPLNPRKTFDPAAIAELADSILAQGLLQNLVVRASPDAPDRWVIVSGERRLRACRLLAEHGPWTADTPIPCRVVAGDDAQHIALAIIENLQRQDVAPLEEARAFAALVQQPDWTPARIAASIGKSARHVELRLALLTRLDPTVIEALESDTITLATARALTAAPAPIQQQMLDRIMRGAPDLRRAEDVSAQIRAQLFPASRAIFDLATYTGPRATCATTGEDLLLDVAAARALQKQAAEAKAEQLHQDGAAWVMIKTDNGWWTPGSGTDRLATATDADADQPQGAVIRIGTDHSVTVFTGLVDLPHEPAPAITAPAAPNIQTDDPPGSVDSTRVYPVDLISDEQKLAAMQAKCQALQVAIANHPTAWLAVLVTALLGQDQVAGITLAAAPAGIAPDISTDMIRRAEQLGINPPPANSTDTLACLLPAEPADLVIFAKALITSRIGPRWQMARANIGDSPAILDLAIATCAGLYLPATSPPEMSFSTYAEVMTALQGLAA